VSATDRLYPNRPFLAASVAVFRDGRVLVASRTQAPLQALYSLPGGLVEPGETVAQAALRELREEVAVEAELVSFLRPVEIIARDPDGRVRHHFVVLAHVARWLAGEGTIGLEAGDVRWIEEGEVESLPTTPGLPDTLRAAFAFMAGRP
jgi:ADP-ribose pyrophosphatase YjhB (NUDIX family)